MESGKKSILLSIIITLILTSSIAAYARYQPPHTRPGPAADKVSFRAFAQEIVPAALEKGDIDLYLYTLRTETAKEILDKPGIELYRAPATYNAIILNPAPAPQGEFNPLSIREVRFALQYVINRDFVASQIYKGLAVPMVAHVSPYDFDYLTVHDIVREYNIHYDPELAKELITNTLVKVGATLREGKWFYGEKPIRLKFIIRVEDERREMGDLVAVELERLGFTVDRLYQLFGPAIHKVYGTDPRAFDWHLYTEGWGKVSPERYDYGTINQMYASWLGNMPGWQEVGYWQYEHSQLDQIGQRIFKGDFEDLQERNELYRQATDIGIKESVRLWVATVLNNFPADARLTGVTGDLASGPRALWTLREGHIPGESELTIGHLWVWTERTVWNPVGGFGDVYSVDIWRNLHDPPIWRHPFAGLPIPFRVEYEMK